MTICSSCRIFFGVSFLYLSACNVEFVKLEQTFDRFKLSRRVREKCKISQSCLQILILLRCYLIAEAFSYLWTKIYPKILIFSEVMVQSCPDKLRLYCVSRKIWFYAEGCNKFRNLLSHQSPHCCERQTEDLGLIMVFSFLTPIKPLAPKAIIRAPFTFCNWNLFPDGVTSNSNRAVSFSPAA